MRVDVLGGVESVPPDTKVEEIAKIFFELTSNPGRARVKDRQPTAFSEAMHSCEVVLAKAWILGRENPISTHPDVLRLIAQMMDDGVSDHLNPPLTRCRAQTVQVVGIAERPLNPSEVDRLISTPPPRTRMALLRWRDQKVGYAQFLQSGERFLGLSKRLVKELNDDHARASNAR